MIFVLCKWGSQWLRHETYQQQIIRRHDYRIRPGYYTDTLTSRPLGWISTFSPDQCWQCLITFSAKINFEWQIAEWWSRWMSDEWCRRCRCRSWPLFWWNIWNISTFPELIRAQARCQSPVHLSAGPRCGSWHSALASNFSGTGQWARPGVATPAPPADM